MNPMTATSDILTAAISGFCEGAGLSRRESQILQLAAHGLADKQISGELTLAYTTVKSYWSRIYSKVSVSNRQLVIGKLLIALATPPDRNSAADPSRHKKARSFNPPKTAGEQMSQE
jgi:DNA-binding CsgD family transcriptional regulator